MPLTSELADRLSVLSSFIRDWFPISQELDRLWRAITEEAGTIWPLYRQGTHYPYGLVGHAAGYRLRFLYELPHPDYLPGIHGADLLTGRLVGLDDPPYPHNPHVLVPPDEWMGWQLFCDRFFYEQLPRHLERAVPLGRRLDHEIEVPIAGCCYVLAMFEALARSGPDAWANSPLRAGPDFSTSGLLTEAGPELLADITAMGDLFLARQAHLLDADALWDPPLTGSGDVGGADPDVLFGRVLVDIKATVHPEKLRADWLWQLIAYTLLDYDDDYGIEAIGIYLARQGELVVIPVDELLGLCTLRGHQPRPLPELRADLRAALSTTS